MVFCAVAVNALTIVAVTKVLTLHVGKTGRLAVGRTDSPLNAVQSLCSSAIRLHVPSPLRQWARAAKWGGCRRSIASQARVRPGGLGAPWTAA